VAHARALIMHSGLVLALCFALAPRPSCAADDPLRGVVRANRSCELGDRALREGAYEQARAHFLQALEISPGFPPAQIGLGSLAMALGNFEEALERYEGARAGYEALGRALLDIEIRRYGDAPRVIGMFSDSMDNRSGTDENRATSTFSGTAPPPGRSFLARFESIGLPEGKHAGEAPGKIYFYIGNALYRLGRYEQAYAAYQRCIELTPGFSMVYNNLALVEWRRGNLPAAQAALAKAEELGFPVNPKFKEDLARAGK